MRSIRDITQSGRRLGGLCVALLFSFVAGGCSLLDVEDPESARLTLDGSSGTQVRFVVANRFQVVNNPEGGQETNLLDADTSWVGVPFDESYDIRQTGQFYVRAFDVDSASPVITMRVYINGRLDYDVSRNLLETPLEFLFTSYTVR